MTLERRREIEAMLSQISQLPDGEEWFWESADHYDGGILTERELFGPRLYNNHPSTEPEGKQADIDHEFVAQAPRIIRELLAEIDRLKPYENRLGVRTASAR